MQVDAIYSSVYAAAAGRQPWHQALNGVAERLDLWGAQIVGLDRRRRALVFSAGSTRTPPEVELDYIRFYHSINPRVPPSLALSKGEWMHCHRLFDERYVAADRFYQDFLIPHGGRYLSGSKVYQDDDFIFLLGVMRGVGSPPIAEDEMPFLQSLGFHLGEALHNLVHLQDTYAELQMAQAFFSQFPYPMFLLDDAQGIAHSNAQAQAMLQSGEIVSQRGGVLVCNTHEENQRLSEAIRAVQLCARGTPARKVVTLERQGRRVHLFVSAVHPLEAMNMFGTAPRALVIVHDERDAKGELDPLLVAECFSLTPAEARVAVKLAEGLTVADVAAEHGTSVHTVRTQVQQVLQKLGLTRQADLVRMLVELPLRRQVAPRARAGG
jgi:DNA-binding CsgD family transcriptional regulator/PAS domain-containing protein